MYRKIWRNCSKSVAQLNFYTESDIKILNLTGFKASNYLVTDECIKKIAPYDKVEIRFFDADGFTPLASKTLLKGQLEKRIIVGLDDRFMNFVIINIDFPEFEQIPDLQINEEGAYEIGQPVAVLGCQISQDNLSIKQGIISSLLYWKGKKYLQVDTSLKMGNAGSPLISVETGQVVGVIGNKLTEISHSYRKLKEIMNSNINLLKKYQGKYSFEDIDPIQVLIANQNQIKYITKEIYRTADMGNGYAVPSKRIVNFIKENLIIEQPETLDDILTGL